MNPFEPYDCIFTEEERKQLISQSLAQLRKGKGLSQKEVATALGISQATYSTYERGRTEPPAELLVRLSFMYGVSLDIIMQRDRLVRNAGEAQRELDDLRKQLQECEEQITAKGVTDPAAAELLKAMNTLLDASEKVNTAILMQQL